jgi:iron complex outermembrane recepter protein
LRPRWESPSFGVFRFGTLDAERAAGPVVGYIAGCSASGSKTDTPLLETPQSISVIKRDRLDDQGVQTLQDSLSRKERVAVESAASAV